MEKKKRYGACRWGRGRRVGRCEGGLDGRGVEHLPVSHRWNSSCVKTHDAARSAKGLRGEVDAELGLDDARVAVGTGDAAPDDADARAVDLSLGLVDVGDALWVSICLP